MSRKEEYSPIYSPREDKGEPCEVILYYWNTILYPLPQIYGLIHALCSCFGYCYRFPGLKNVNKLVSQTGHLSMELRYDKKDGEYRRSYYISLYPDSDKVCSEFYPRLAVMHGRVKDLDLQEEKWNTCPSKKIVLTGLNFGRMHLEIDRIFENRHQLNSERRWSIEDDGIMQPIQDRGLENPIESKDKLDIRSIEPVKWALIKCCSPGKTHSCSTIVNEILVEGGLDVSCENRFGGFLESLFWTILSIIILLGIALGIDYSTDREVDHFYLDLGLAIGIGVGLLYEHGLALDGLLCCKKSPFIRPQSVVWKAEMSRHKTSIVEYKNWLFQTTGTPRNFDLDRRYNSPIDNGTTHLRNNEDKYENHVCAV